MAKGRSKKQGSTSRRSGPRKRRTHPLVSWVRSAERATAALAKHEHELVGLARTDPLRAVELNMLVARMKAKCDVALELVGAMRARLAEIERVNAPDACAPRVVSRNRRKRDG